MLRIAVFLKIDLIFDKVYKFLFLIKLKRYEIESNQKINFVKQGPYNLDLLGEDLKKFKIDCTSHLKSNTTIECTGGVEIGKYFHVGKGLTIFSADHNWKTAQKIPYDENIVYQGVIIGDFVWAGANVTIIPGVCIGEGVIIAGGSVVTKNVDSYKVVGGNPAKVIGERNIEEFKRLKNQKQFFK